MSADLDKKIKLALDESRMLILGAQVLLGFQFSASFLAGFHDLPRLSQQLNLLALGVIVVATILLIWPSAYHQIVTGGSDSPDVLRFSTGVMEWALLPFVVVLGVDVFIPASRFLSARISLVMAMLIAGTALAFWFGPGIRSRLRQSSAVPKLVKPDPPQDGRGSPSQTPLPQRIEQVLIESRVALPGAQALLGFQFSVMLQKDFDQLPKSLQYIHLASLLLIAFATILLIAPAAYHRVVERGENTEHFFLVAHRLVIAALVPLALGVCGDLFVVAEKISDSTALACTIAGVMLALFGGLWFGYTAWQKSRRRALDLAGSRNSAQQIRYGKSQG